MTTDEMRYFIAVYEAKSLAQAAAALSISSQGLGKSIKRLEGKLGVELFTRTPQGITPTEAADAVYPYFVSAVAQEDLALRALDRFKSAPRVLHLVGRDSNLGDVIAQGARDYAKLAGVEFAFDFSRESEDDQARLFVDNEYDYRFLSVEIDALPNLPHESLCVLHYVPVVNSKSELASRATIGYDDLRNRTILVENRKYAHARILEKNCREHGFEPHLREVDKTYIWSLLSKPGDEISFIRVSEASGYPWTSSAYTMLAMEPPFQTEVVLQTRHPEVDTLLVECIRKRLRAVQFE